MAGYMSKQGDDSRTRDGAASAVPAVGKRTLVEQTAAAPLGATGPTGNAPALAVAGEAAGPAASRGNWLERAFGPVRDPDAQFDAAAAGPAQEVPFRREMEHSFGRDLSGARAVVGRTAELRAMNAAAATRGDTIVFGQANPSKLQVAHELTHYVQNTSSGAAGASTPPLSEPGDGAEREADAVAHRAAAGEQVAVHAAPTGSIQRMLVGCEMETVVPVYKNGARPDHVDGYAAQGSGYDHQNIDGALSAPLGDGFEIHIDDSKTAKRGALDLLNPGAKLQIAEIIAPPVNNRAKLLANLQKAKQYLDHFAQNRERAGSAYSMGWPVPKDRWQASVPAQQPASTDDNSPHQAPAQPRVIEQLALEPVFKADHAGSQSILHRTAAQVTFQGGPDSLKTISDSDTWDYLVPNPAYDPKNPNARQEVATASGKKMPGRIPQNNKVTAPLVDRARMARALDISLGSEAGDAGTRAVDVAVKIFQDTLRLLTQSYAGTVKNAVSYLIRSDLGKLFQDIPPEQRRDLADYVEKAIMRLEPKQLAIQPEIAKQILDETGDIKVESGVYNLLTGQSPREEGELAHVNDSLRQEVAKNTNPSTRRLPWSVFTRWLADQVREAVAGLQAKTPPPEAHAGPTQPVDNDNNNNSGAASNTRGPLVSPSLNPSTTPSHGSNPSAAPPPGSGVTGPLHGMRNLGLLQPDGKTKETKDPGVVFEDRAGIDLDLAQTGSQLPDSVVERLDAVKFPTS